MTPENGKQRLSTFLDDQQMARLYEKFTLEYYKKHFPQYRSVSNQISWDTSEPIDFFPVMQLDIMLTDGHRKFIIDAKYYGRTMQSKYDTATIRSCHLYKIYFYVKDDDKTQSGAVEGITTE